MRLFSRLLTAASVAAAPVAAITVLPSTALAQTTGSAPDFSQLTGGIDFSTLLTALMAVGVLVIGIAVAMVGIRKVVRMVRGA